MSVVSRKDVLHVAKLAQLTLTKEEEEKYARQLSEVVDYVRELDEVNTDGVTPTSQTTGLEDVSRNDEIEPQQVLTKDEVLSGTDLTHNGYFVVGALLTERGEK